MILDEELKEEENQPLENMSEEEFQEFFDKIFIPYKKAFEELA